MNPDTLIVLLTAAAQIGALILFLGKWERRITRIETILQILAVKNGLYKPDEPITERP